MMAISGSFYLAAWLLAALLGWQQNAQSEPLRDNAPERVAASEPQIAVQLAQNLLDNGELLQKPKPICNRCLNFRAKHC